MGNPQGPIKCLACPNNTYSAANTTTTTVLACRCSPGFLCSYTKTIPGVVSLGGSMSTLTANTTQSIAQEIARAAGIGIDRITIKAVQQRSAG